MLFVFLPIVTMMVGFGVGFWSGRRWERTRSAQSSEATNAERSVAVIPVQSSRFPATPTTSFKSAPESTGTPYLPTPVTPYPVLRDDAFESTLTAPSTTGRLVHPSGVILKGTHDMSSEMPTTTPISKPAAPPLPPPKPKRLLQHPMPSPLSQVTTAPLSRPSPSPHSPPSSSTQPEATPATLPAVTASDDVTRAINALAEALGQQSLDRPAYGAPISNLENSADRMVHREMDAVGSDPLPPLYQSEWGGARSVTYHAQPISGSTRSQVNPGFQPKAG